MATGAIYTDFSSEKRLLGVSDFGSRFLEHLRGLVQESTEKSFRTGGVFDTALGLSAGGNDKFDIDGTSQATDGFGHILDIDAFGFGTAVPFENTSAVDYEVALHYTEVPNGVQVNPRKGLPEYIAVEEALGESADPDLVTDNGSNITFRIDSVAEAGISHAGRTARVWKKILGENGTTSVIAIEDVVVTWTGSNNEITTTGLLGQSTVSTTVGDYTVVMLGPTVRRNSTLLGVDGYAFLGVVTGVGAGSPPSVFDVTGQNVITWSFSNLQDITSINTTTDRLKIDVKSYAGDVGDPQIAVKNPAGSDVFTIDGDGNVAIDGGTILRGMAPKTHDAHNIGSSGTRWQRLYLEGIAFIGEIILTDTAGNGVGSDLIPDSTNARDLGSSARQFAETYTRDLFVGTGAGEGVVTNLVPATGSLDLGNLSYLWNNIFVSNINISGNFLPITGTQDLGSTGSPWQDLFISRAADINTLIVSDSANEGVGGSLVPVDDDSLDLGNTNYRWKTGWLHELNVSDVAGEGVTNHLVPSVDGTKDLGNLNYRWGTLVFDKLNLSDVAGEGVVSDFVPAVNDNLTLGNNSYRWSNIYLQYLFLSDDADEGVVNNFVPKLNDVYHLGNVDYRWSSLYLQYLNLSSVASEGVTADLNPSGTNKDLGSASYAWDTAYIEDIYSKQTLYTYDNQDDLELIAAFGPLENSPTEDVERGGSARSMQLADMSTFPWPMLGPRDPDRKSWYVSIGDSFSFLLGGVKQLYLKHKEEVASLQTQIDVLNQRLNEMA